MAKRTFKTDLSSDGIDALIRQLDNWRLNTLQQRVDMLAKELADEGVSIAQVNVASYDAIFTGELIASIHTVFESSGNGNCVFYVRADSEHAAFVEFGTGIMGSEGSYPYKIPEDIEWKYITGRQLIDNIQKGVYGWYYKDAKGEYRFTQGMPSRPFMYDTYLDLFSLVENKARRIFKDA